MFFFIMLDIIKCEPKCIPILLDGVNFDQIKVKELLDLIFPTGYDSIRVHFWRILHPKHKIFLRVTTITFNY